MPDFASIAVITVNTKKIDIKNVEEKWKEVISKAWKKSKDMKFSHVTSIEKVNNIMKILKQISIA